jgi:hypothetical protein
VPVPSAVLHERETSPMEQSMNQQNIPHFQPISIPVETAEEVQPQGGMNTRQKLAVIVLDILMLVELAVAIALAAKNPDTFTPTFMKSFFLMLVPTLILGYLAIRRLGRATEHSRS